MNDLDELNFTPLPPVTDQDLAMVRGVVNSNRLHMIKGLASVPLSEEFDFLGCDGRPIRIPDSVRHPGHKLEGAAQAAHMLRLTLTGAIRSWPSTPRGSCGRAGRTAGGPPRTCSR